MPETESARFSRGEKGDILKNVVKILNEFEDHFCAIILAIMTVLAFINVIARYVFLASYPWVEELNRLGLVMLTYLGAAVALKDHAHLGLSILTDRFPRRAQIAVSVLGCAAGLFFCFIAARYGCSMVVSEYQHKVLTQGMQWPEYLFGLWLPVGCVFLAIRFLQQAIRLIIGKEDKEA